MLARLALAAPRAVPVDVLVADVWGDDPPPSAVDALRVHVSNLRKLLAGGDRTASEVLRTAPAGYRLDVPPGAVDAARLERAGRDRDLPALRALLGSWPDGDLGRLDAGSGWFEAAARRIDDQRLAAVEAVAAADLAAGRAGAAAALLDEAVARAPFRERLWELLVQALAAGDRRAEALRAFQRARAALAEVGMEPGPALVAAERGVTAPPGTVGGASTGPRPSPRLTADYVEVDGSRVAFATAGRKGTDLLFLHGGFVPFEVMAESPRLARFLDRLAERFRVVHVDRRGIGMSDRPADGSPVVLDHWVADCGAVLDAIGARDVIAFGHEHGGPVAIRLAAERPHQVRGLVLHSTAARPLRGPDHPYGPSHDAVDRIDRMIDRLPGSDDLLALVAPSAGDDHDLRAWLERAGRLGAGPAMARELHRAYLYADVRDVLPHVRAPAVVLHPARMVRTDPGQARYLAEHLPEAELQLLDSADHLFWLTDGDVVLAAIERLAGRLRAGSSGPPARLRAVVAVAPPVAAGPLAVHGAETLVPVPGAVVATFTSLGAARAAVDAVRHAHAAASVVLDVADTTGEATDAAVLVAAQAAAAARGARAAGGDDDAR